MRDHRANSCNIRVSILISDKNKEIPYIHQAYLGLSYYPNKLLLKLLWEKFNEQFACAN